MSIGAASGEFQVPRTTISDHVRNPMLNINQGRPRQLSHDEENGLVNFILYMAGQGFPMTRNMIRCYIQEIFKRSDRPIAFNLDKGPSDKWFQTMKMEHPKLSERLAENQDRSRTRMSNIKVISDFFHFWKSVLDDLGVADKPEQIFNCDETGWSGKETSRDKVLAPKLGHVFKQKVLKSDHVTAHLCVSADGKFIPPMEKFATISTNLGFVSQGIVIGKVRFPVVLNHALDQMTSATVKEGFRKSGILPYNPDAIDKSQLAPATFTKHPSEQGEEKEEQTRTCEACGQFIGVNPLVKRGIVPQSLAYVLIPPTNNSKPQNKKRKVVSEGGVVSSDEMLKTLKEKEEREKKQIEAKEERIMLKEKRMQQKQQEAEERLMKKKKREEEKKQREEKMKEERIRKVVGGRLVSKKFTCGVCGEIGRKNDEMNGVMWYGCDESMCERWYHEECLSIKEREYVNESMEDGSDWYCKKCKPWVYEEE